MKHFYTRALMLLLALTWLVPKANAQVSLQSTTPVATHSTGGWAGSSGNVVAQIAVTNDVVYTIMTGGKRISYWNASTGTDGSYSYDSASNGAFGPGICTDDNGNLVFASGPSYSSRIQQISVVSKSSANGIVVDFANQTKIISLAGKYTTTLSGDNQGATTNAKGLTNVIRASGNCYNGEGALWLTNGQKVVKIPIINGVAQTETVYSVPLKNPNNTLDFGGSHNEAWSTESNIFPYADGKYILINRNGTFLCTLSGSTFNWSEQVNNSWNPYNAADIQYIGGHEIIVHQATAGVNSGRDGKITITDRTSGKSLATGIYAYGSSGTLSSNSAVSIINAWCEFSPIETGKYGLYTYTPGRGFAKYILNYVATDPVQNLAVEVVKSQDQLGRQDAVLTWQAPAKGEVASYTIYSRENPWYSMEGNGVDSNGDGYSDAPLRRQDTWSAWTAIGTTTDLTYTDIDVCMYASSISRSYQYKVVPNFKDGGIGAESDVLEITPEFIPFVPVWDTTMDQDDKKFGIDRYDGYCKVQLYWKFPQVNNYNYFPSGQKSVYGVKPDYYSVLRDGKVIVPYTTTYNYIDTDVKSEHTYTYQVVSHYTDFPNDTAVSAPNTVYVAKRDWAKVGYELTEIYNYKIAASGDSVHVPSSSYSNMANYAYAYYKQAVYHDGYWYVAQNTNAGETNGGIIKISAAAPWENKTENVLTPGTVFYQHSTHYSTNPAYRNIGIATDYEGNLFIQSASLNASGTSRTSAYYNRIAEGKVFIKGNNGSYTTYTVDLSGIDFTEYTEHDPSKYLTTAAGRCDFYTMGGKLKTDGYAYLYLAPSVSKAAFVVKLTYTGSAVTATLVNKLQDTEGRRTWNGEPFLQNNENLIIPVNCTGRQGEFLHLIRSSALSLWSRNDNSELATRKTNVYDTQARVNTPGGCTLEFNGELFLITPTSQYSVNKGNFYVGMAERGDGDAPAEANFGHIIPVVQYQQDDAEDGGGTSSGTVSIFAEVGEDDINGDGILNDYAYIYLYSPSGQRFAKYRLTPSTGFPPSQVTLEINAKYAEDYDAANHNPGGDIAQFDATASWAQVSDYGTTEGGNIFYSIMSYTLQLVDAAGNPITETDTNGNLLYPAIEFDVDGNGVPTKVYTVTYNGNVKTKTAVSEDSETFKNLSYATNDEGIVIYSYIYPNVKKEVDYTALVTVNYIGVDESNTGVQQKSMTTEWETANTYQPEEATGTVLVDVKKDNWSDWDADYKGNPANGGAKDDDDAYFDSYRVCLKLANPDFGAGVVYPRSYYTIGIDKDKDGVVDQEVTNFHLYIGVGNSIETKAFKALATTTADSDGYIEITDGQISGDYNFDIETGGKPHVYWDMLDYTAPAYYDDGVTYTESDNPSTWNYIVTTTYAASNARISEAVTSPMETDNGGITTGVEVISTQAVLNVYPIPATISVTIKCSEAIENIEIYSESGMLVSKMSGNGEQIMTVNISDLASGYYFMRVNNLAPVKIIKN